MIFMGLTSLFAEVMGMSAHLCCVGDGGWMMVMFVCWKIVLLMVM